jgi:hypothetical protein
MAPLLQPWLEEKDVSLSSAMHWTSRGRASGHKQTSGLRYLWGVPWSWTCEFWGFGSWLPPLASGVACTWNQLKLHVLPLTEPVVFVSWSVRPGGIFFCCLWGRRHTGGLKVFVDCCALFERSRVEGVWVCTCVCERVFGDSGLCVLGFVLIAACGTMWAGLKCWAYVNAVWLFSLFLLLFLCMCQNDGEKMNKQRSCFANSVCTASSL